MTYSKNKMQGRKNLAFKTDSAQAHLLCYTAIEIIIIYKTQFLSDIYDKKIDIV